MPPAFNLQSVLDVRHSRVEALEIELGKLLALQLNAQNLLAELRSTQRTLMSELAGAQQGEIDLFAISVLRKNIQAIGERMDFVEEKLRQISVEVERKRKELILAKQEEETLQILNRKRIEAYNAEQARLESAVQDDIYIAQAFRQRYQEA